MTELNYQSFIPSAGDTVSPADWCEVCSLNPAGTLLTLTINMPKYPKDKQPFTINSTKAVTTLTLQVTSGTGQTLLAALTALVIGVAARYVYDAPNITWRLA